VSKRERGRYLAYVPEYPRSWWLHTGPYRRFAAREITSMFAAAFSGLLLLFLVALSRGREAYEGFLRWLKLPAVVAVFAVILVAVLYHMATWFRLTAHIQVVRLGRKVLPRSVVIAGLFGTWVLASVIVAYIHIWF
jgi:fumarate reductase subunit C